MTRTPSSTLRSLLVASGIALWLAACGGGGGTAAPTPAPTPSPGAVTNPLPEPPPGGFPASGPTAAPSGVPNDVESVRFLAQSTFGATTGEVARLQRLGYGDWIEQQFRIPRTSHLDFVLAVYPIPTPEGVTVAIDPLYQTFWKQAATAPDQLRHRVAFALSQIFVVSLTNDAVSEYRRGVASYLDMLGREAFGNYRDLLESVTLHPMMGLFLSHLRNQKESGNRVPDQNYAREVMQLFSIGLYQLNPDGTLMLANGQPVETYGQEDIVGLSRVFTGFSWAGPDTQNGRFFGSAIRPPTRIATCCRCRPTRSITRPR